MRSVLDSVLAKVLLLSFVLAIIASVSNLVTLSVSLNRLYGAAVNEEVSTAVANVRVDLESQRQAADMLSVSVANNPEIQQAFAQRDRDRLKELTVPVFKALKEQYKVAQFQFHTPPATSFLRVHKPKKFGDDLSGFRFTVLDTNNAKQPKGGTEGGVAGLGIRSVQPVFWQGEHIGSVEFGMSLGEGFVKRLTAEYNAPVALWAPDTKQNNTMAEVASTLPKSFTPNTKYLDMAIKGELVANEQMVAGKQQRVVYIPVTSYTKETVAVAVYLLDISTMAGNLSGALTTGWIIVAVVFVVAIVLSILMAKWITNSVNRPIREVNEVLNQVGQGDLTVRAKNYHEATVSRLSRRLNRTLDSISDTMLTLRNSVTVLEEKFSEVSEAAVQADTNASQALEISSEMERTSEALTSQLQTLSAATDEFAASIRDISANTAKAAEVGSAAVDRRERDQYASCPVG